MPLDAVGEPGAEDAPTRLAGPRHGVLLQVAYDGSLFNGWATQKEGRTVQDTLAVAIRALDPDASAPRGTSRTDAGVHAEGQLVGFDASLTIPPRGWVLALNQRLPDDVSVRVARLVPPAYNPRFASRMKRYRYRILLDRVRNPLLRSRAWRIGWKLDLESMARELASIEGTHDFAAFRAAADGRMDTVRTMRRATLEVDAELRVVSVVIEGDAFLYNMVRILVGTLIDVARGKLEEGTIARAIRAKERSGAGMTAPAHGLTLEWIDVVLPEGASDPWPQ